MSKVLQPWAAAALYTSDWTSQCSTPYSGRVFGIRLAAAPVAAHRPNGPPRAGFVLPRNLKTQEPNP